MMDNICTSQSIGVTDILASLLHSTGCQFDTNYSSIIRVGTATTVLLRGPWEIHKGFVPPFNFMILLHVNCHNVERARTKQPFSLAVQEKSVDLGMMFQPFFVFTLQKYWVSYSPSGFIGPTVSETDSKMKSSVTHPLLQFTWLATLQPDRFLQNYHNTSCFWTVFKCVVGGTCNFQ